MSRVVRTDKFNAGVDRPSPKRAASRYVVGEIIAEKYKLVSLLGEGGMGSIWVAKNLALDAQVGLKLIRGDMASPATEERFLTEARAAARLKHPAICRVFDFGRTRHDEPFIVMELLQGETLGEVLDREGKLESIQSVQILLPIADALSSAHGRGVVHRDLKPDNIYLADTDGRLQPKILDFGVAKLAASPVSDTRITQAGTVVGSPDYMSPEQARGVDDIDHRADIWGLSVLLYECCTGRVPFEDVNYNALLRHIIEDEIPSILELGAGDADLWAILSKGLAKDRVLRYQSMRELGADLAGWLLARGVSEDLSGHSLRATWVEPMPPGRISLVSMASVRGSTPPPGAPSPSQAPPNATPMPSVPRLPPVVAPPVPVGDAQLASHGSDPSRRKWALALIGGSLLIAVGFVVVRALTASTAPAPSAATLPAPPTPASSPTPTTTSPSSASSLPIAPEPAATRADEPKAATAPVRGKPRPITPPPAPDPGPSAKSSPTPAPTPAKPKGGYAEDLGF
ncbi:MAG: serine/threonine protein kinase [Myxococcales bacterium]|nr:serine/threonine protein kinase [Myxococcales bacterium]